jgi:hypothetical protein
MKIGNDFKVPKELDDAMFQEDIGGYKVIVDGIKGVFIQGNMTINLHELEVGTVGILPLNAGAQALIEDFPFEIEKHQLVYQVSFNKYAWYFLDRANALELLQIILEVKASALNYEFLDNSYLGH